jgi:DNA mismatch repair protein PMS2
MDDLFIVDQHAADEKYNFEMLQETTKIESQKLFRCVQVRLGTWNMLIVILHPRPQYLEFTAADEMLALENIDILTQNGFEIEVDESDITEDSRRLKLLSIPISKNTVFDVKGEYSARTGLLHPF